MRRAVCDIKPEKEDSGHVPSSVTISRSGAFVNLQTGLRRRCLHKWHVVLLLAVGKRKDWARRRDGCCREQKGVCSNMAPKTDLQALWRQIVRNSRRNYFSMWPKWNGVRNIFPRDALNIVPLGHPEELL